jgi:hypothetical protein
MRAASDGAKAGVVTPDRFTMPGEPALTLGELREQTGNLGDYYRIVLVQKAGIVPLVFYGIDNGPAPDDPGEPGTIYLEVKP